jgi:outer membrane protein TolC
MNIFLLILATTSYAITWDEVRTISKQNDQSVKASDFSLQASLYAKKQSFSSFLPTLTLSARKNKSVAEAYGIESETRAHSVAATASLNLFNGFGSSATLSKAKAAAQEAKAAKDLSSVNARYQLRLAFTDLLISQERIKIFEKSLKRQQQNEKLVSIKYESGTEAKWNLLKTKAERERAEYNLEAARSSWTSAKENLLSLLNIENLPNYQVSSPIDELKIPREIQENEILTNHPRFQEASFAKDRVEKDVTLARSAFFPTIDLNYSKNREFNEIGSKTRTDSTGWSIVAQWNIFNGFSDFHNWQKTRMATAASKENLEKTQLVLLQDIRSSMRELKVSISRLPSTKSIREAAESRVKTVSAQYRSGLKSYLDWEQAEAQLNESEQTEVSALANAFESLANFEKSIGKTLDE